MIVALVTIPTLVRALGLDRFGVLSLAWIVIGYFSLFDLGIGRALTKLVADKLAAHEEHSIPPLAWTGLLLMLLLGGVGGLATLAISPWLVRGALKIPAALQLETQRSFFLLALSIPLVTLASGLRGILEAQQRFRVLNLIRVPMSIFSFAAPLLVLPFSHGLFPVIGVLMLGRLIGCAVHVLACLHSMPALRHNFSINLSLVIPLVKFGGWLTIANIIGLFMLYMDRFLIGVLLSVGAITYYTVPFDMVNRLTLIPVAVAGVLFPAFAASLVQDPNRAGLLLSRGLKYVCMVVFPIVLAVIAFAPETLLLWLGPAFSQNGSAVLRWIAAGVFILSLATIPFALIQSAGRPDITAKLQLAELPVYLAVLWLLTKRFGIEGTAITWVGRLALDSVLLFFYAHRLLPQKRQFLATLGVAVPVALLSFYLISATGSLILRAIFFTVGCLVFALAGWRWGLDSGERIFLLRTPKGVLGKVLAN